MGGDIYTVIWKEWRELAARSAQSRATTVKTILVLGVILGIIVWRAAFLLNNIGAFLIPSVVLINLVAGLMADSFAGERERHTLETMLASRLSDLAILVGKIAAGVLLAWGSVVLTMVLVIVSAIVREPAMRLPLSARDFIAILIMYLLVCLAISCASVLVSLRASTVRQAMQTLSYSFMIVFFAIIFGSVRLPVEWRKTLFEFFGGGHLMRTEVVVSLILAGLVAILFSAARLRFQRSRLVLL